MSMARGPKGGSKSGHSTGKPAFPTGAGLFKTLVENSHDLICALDLEGRFTYLNPQAERLSGYKAEELLGKHFSGHFPPEELPKAEEAINKALQGELSRFEVGMLHRSGYVGWLFASVAPLRARRKIAGAICFGRNITEEKRAEDALRESEAQFRTLCETTRTMILIYQDDRFQYANPAARAVLGFNEAEFKKMNFWNLVHPDYREIVRLRGRERQKGEMPPLKYELRYLTRDGSEIWVAANTGSIFYKGRPAGVVSAVDITDQKTAQDNLRVERDRAQAYLDTAPVMILALDRDGKVTLVNRKCCAILGYEEVEIVGQDWFERFIPPESKDAIRALYAKVMNGEEPPREHYETHLLTMAGERILVAWRSALLRDKDGAIVGVLSSGLDITERKRQEEALKQSEEHYRQIIEQIDEIVYRVSLEEDPLASRVQYVSPRSLDLLGYTPEEFMQDSSLWFECLHPEDRERVASGTRDLLTTPKAILREYRLLARSREYVWMEDRIVPQLDPEGKVTAFQGVARDVTARKRYEEEILRKNRQLGALLTSAQAMGGFSDLKAAEKAICEAALAAFGAKMAWIGLIEPDSTEVVPLVSAGVDEGYTATIKIRWNESPLGRGPGGMAIKQRRPWVMDVDDPGFAPWAEESKKRGYKQACALPLVHEDAVRGVIALYSERSGAFGPTELEVLEIFAKQATLVIVNASLYDEAIHTIRELASANEDLEKTEEELQVRTAFFEELFASSPEAVAILDQNDRIINVNRAFEQLFQFCLEEIKGLPINHVVVPIGLAEEATAISAKALAGEIVQAETVRCRKDGSEFPVSVMGAPIRTGHEQVAVLAIYRDISESKRAEAALRESEARLRALFEAEPECIKVVSEDGTLLDMNPAGLAMIAMTRDEAIGCSIYDIIAPEDREAFRDLTESACRGEKGLLEFDILAKDGHRRHMSTHAAPVRLGPRGPQACLAITREVPAKR